MRVLIINYNRLTLPLNMANWLSVRGCTPIFIDNNSDYPPLLKYYSTCPYKVVRMNKNYGHRVVWEQNILDALRINTEYIVTDPDLDLSGIPDDFLRILIEGLQKYPSVHKCGFSLEIEDVINNEEYNGGKTIREWEDIFWKYPLDKMYFDAQIDTTFALYRRGIRRYSYSAIRTNRPYTARHVPWYYDDMGELPEDEQYYFKTANESATFKKLNVFKK